MAIRRSVSCLSADDRQAFVRAVKLLKDPHHAPSQFTPPTPSRYDDYVYIHAQAMSKIPTAVPVGTNMTGSMPGMAHHDTMYAHACPAFLPWHRELLHQFELDLQRVSSDPNLAIPYWDWTVDQSPAGAPWLDDFMGGNGNQAEGWAVTSGPFQRGEWVVNVSVRNDPATDIPTWITRNFSGALPDANALVATLAQKVYDALPFDATPKATFRSQLEGYYPGGAAGSGMHNLVHQWIGGTMSSQINSPNDPIFFLHHANVDRIWDLWQQTACGRGQYLPQSPALTYPRPGQAGPTSMIFYDPARSTTPPWPYPAVTPNQMLDITVPGLNYSYAECPRH